jgi:hypothetical protein
MVNSVDLSTHIDQCTIEQMYADVDVSTFGTTSKLHAAGLSDNKVTLNFLQDYAAASVDATIFPLVGLTTSVSVQPVSGATSTVNPVYTFTAVVLQWKPLDSKASVTWPISGNVVRNVT